MFVFLLCKCISVFFVTFLAVIAVNRTKKDLLRIIRHNITNPVLSRANKKSKSKRYVYPRSAKAFNETLEWKPRSRQIFRFLVTEFFCTRPFVILIAPPVLMKHQMPLRGPGF